MIELLSNIWNSVFTSPFIVPVVLFICIFWRKIFKIKSDNELKRLMLEKGMSADEIEQVMSAGSKKWKK